jgi:predicted dehydrogenase
MIGFAVITILSVFSRKTKFQNMHKRFLGCEAMRKLRVAIVGAGLIGMRHADAVIRHPQATLVALADSNAQSLSRGLSALGDVRGYTDYKRMLEELELDVLHNCTPNFLHHAVSEAALSRGLHVYGEKPLAETVSEGEALVSLAKAKKVKNAVNFNYRGNICVQEMRNRLKTSSGRVFVIHGSYLQDWLSRETDYNWRLETKGPRSLADIGSHWLDLAQFIYGKRIVSVNASLFTSWQKRLNGDKPIDISSDDGASLSLRFEDGLLANAIISQVSGGYKNHIALSVDCENYSMRWQQQAADRLVIGRRDGGEETLYADSAWPSAQGKRSSLPAGHSQAWADALSNTISDFYEMILSDTSSPNVATFEDGLNIMKLAEACLASGRDGTWHSVE